MTLATSLTPIRPAIQALQPQLVQWRRTLHQRPELGFREVETAARVAELLRQWGYQPQTGIAQTGVVAVISGSRPGPVIGLRADMDALPIQELNTVPYRSQIDGVMHACGHDGHTAILLGVAHYLAHQREHLRGTVKLIFQPAEEGPGGAKPMIEAGVLEHPRVEAMFGLHLWNDLPAGSVGVRSGPLMAASDFFRCHIQGRGGAWRQTPANRGCPGGGGAGGGGITECGGPANQPPGTGGSDGGGIAQRSCPECHCRPGDPGGHGALLQPGFSQGDPPKVGNHHPRDLPSLRCHLPLGLRIPLPAVGE